MEYLTVKWLHIISAIVMLGTGIGSAWFWLMAHRQKNLRVRAEIARQVVRADWVFTTPSIVVLLLSGAWMVDIARYPLDSSWLLVSLILIIVSLAAWLPVVGLQVAMRDELEQVVRGAVLSVYYREWQRLWLILGWIAFPATLAIVYMMVVKPWW